MEKDTLKFDEVAHKELRRLFETEVEAIAEFLKQGGDIRGQRISLDNANYIAASVAVARILDGYFIDAAKKILYDAKEMLDDVNKVNASQIQSLLVKP